MEECLDTIVLILEQFLAPQETIYHYISAEFSHTIDLMFDSAGLVLLVIAISLIPIGLLTTILLDFRGADRSADFYVYLLATILIMGFGLSLITGYATKLGLLGSTTILLFGGSILFAKMCFGYSAYKAGYWSGTNALSFVLALALAIMAGILVNRQGVALVVSCLLVGSSIGLLIKDLVSETIESHPLLTLGLILLAILGAVFEPEYMRRSLELLDPESVLAGSLSLGYHYLDYALFLLGFAPGFFIGLARWNRARRHWLH